MVDIEVTDVAPTNDGSKLQTEVNVASPLCCSAHLLYTLHHDTFTFATTHYILTPRRVAFHLFGIAVAGSAHVCVALNLHCMTGCVVVVMRVRFLSCARQCNLPPMLFMTTHNCQLPLRHM